MPYGSGKTEFGVWFDLFVTDNVCCYAISPFHQLNYKAAFDHAWPHTRERMSVIYSSAIISKYSKACIALYNLRITIIKYFTHQPYSGLKNQIDRVVKYVYIHVEWGIIIAILLPAIAMALLFKFTLFSQTSQW